ncbi:hypothetical protein Cgig2_009724 [Carnegiea gigantea]|uniref:SAM-dependent methyltransferase RsmB-F/NOP2-type catalytic core domain-containing protein n=1 Tax=Carnegiea gigantea TaxID=171969 RepID=A0A9Q1K5F0_9CARY|nr:hypothetical protein Cgig2_009724 [Carnegiea gigantea]
MGYFDFAVFVGLDYVVYARGSRRHDVGYAASLGQPLKQGLHIGQGATITSRAGIFRALEGGFIYVTNRVYDLRSFNNVLEDEIFLQNLSSFIAIHTLDPQKGEWIFDTCVAPKGKTTASAMLMGDQGDLITTYRSHNKVMVVQHLAPELGLKCLVAYKLDALKSVAEKGEPQGSGLNDGEVSHMRRPVQINPGDKELSTPSPEANAVLEQVIDEIEATPQQPSNRTVIEQGQNSARVLPTFASLVDPNEGTALEFIPAIEINGTKCAQLYAEDIEDESLSKIGSLLGYPLKTDKYIKDKSMLKYARLMVEMSLEGQFPEYIEFANEKGVLLRQKVTYEWMPIKCDKRKMFGHTQEQCRK